MKEEYLTLEEVRRLTGVMDICLREWHKDGTFEATIADGDDLYYSIADIRTFEEKYSYFDRIKLQRPFVKKIRKESNRKLIQRYKDEGRMPQGLTEERELELLELMGESI
jgi:hypothetical protein